MSVLSKNYTLSKGCCCSGIPSYWYSAGIWQWARCRRTENQYRIFRGRTSRWNQLAGRSRNRRQRQYAGCVWRTCDAAWCDKVKIDRCKEIRQWCGVDRYQCQKSRRQIINNMLRWFAAFFLNKFPLHIIKHFLTMIFRYICKFMPWCTLASNIHTCNTICIQ